MIEGFFGLIFGVFILVALGIAGYYLYNLAQETVTRKAKVVAKRTAIGQAANGHSAQTSYYCTFEFDDGQRAEYTSVPDNTD